MPPTTDSWLTAADVARKLGVEVSTVTRWVRTGKLEAITLPSGRHRIHPDEVDRIISGRAS